MINLFEAKVVSYGSDDWKGTINATILGMDQEGLIEHIQMLQFYGNEAYGSCILPEIDDIILISFLDENYQRAICLGSPFKKSNQLIEEWQEDNSLKLIQTKSNFKFKLTETQDKEQLEIVSSKGYRFLINHEFETIQIGHVDKSIEIFFDLKDKKIESKAEEIKFICDKTKVNFKKDGTILIDANKIEIRGQSLLMDMKQSIELKALDINIKATKEVKIHGSINKVSADMQLALTGQIVQIG